MLTSENLSAEQRVRFLERRLASVVTWIEANQPDAFERGLWTAMRDGAAPEPPADELLLDDARDILIKSSIRVEGNEDFILRLMKAHARSSQPPADEASVQRRLQAYPKLSEFFSKYALGSKLPPSCLVCGQIVVEAGVTHMELPDIQCCKRCKDAADRAAQPPEASNDWGVREAFTTIESYIQPGSALPGAVRYLKLEIRKLEKMVMEESARASSPPGSDDARDAARYRHLRTSRLLPDVLGHELDAAIDAAIAACSGATKRPECQHEKTKPNPTLVPLGSAAFGSSDWTWMCTVCNHRFDLPVASSQGEFDGR